eukprot:4539790-Lingulodinium_polyedra.AAC.1
MLNRRYVGVQAMVNRLSYILQQIVVAVKSPAYPQTVFARRSDRAVVHGVLAMSNDWSQNGQRVVKDGKQMAKFMAKAWPNHGSIKRQVRGQLSRNIGHCVDRFCSRRVALNKAS